MRRDSHALNRGRIVAVYFLRHHDRVEIFNLFFVPSLVLSGSSRQSKMNTFTLPPHRFCANGLFMPLTELMSMRQFVVCESAASTKSGLGTWAASSTKYIEVRSPRPIWVPSFSGDERAALREVNPHLRRIPPFHPVAAGTPLGGDA